MPENGQSFVSGVYGVEHVLGGVLGSPYDLTLFLEHNYDDRGRASPSIYQNDIFFGGRLDFANTLGTTLTAGAYYDLHYGSLIGRVALESRITDNLKLTVEGFAFNANNPKNSLYSARNLDQVSAKLLWSFYEFKQKLFSPFQSEAVCLRDCGLLLADPLHPSERHRIRNAVPKRAREFVSGRSLARRALAILGEGNGGPINNCHFGSPIWPDGVVGSISHSDDEAVAVVARISHISAIGIDVECAKRLEFNVENLVCNSVDRGLRPDCADMPAHWGKLVFSAKEAFYKAVFPRFGRPLDFKHAAIKFTATPGAAHGTFTVVPVAEAKDWPEFSLSLKGNWLVASDRVYCAVMVPVSSSHLG